MVAEFKGLGGLGVWGLGFRGFRGLGFQGGWGEVGAFRIKVCRVLGQGFYTLQVARIEIQAL